MHNHASHVSQIVRTEKERKKLMDQGFHESNKIKMEEQVYILTLNTYYECGEYEDSDSLIIGVYSTADGAKQEAEDYLLENFVYDAELGVFYCNGCDEAWVSIWEFDVDQKVDFNKSPIMHIPEKEGGMKHK